MLARLLLALLTLTLIATASHAAWQIESPDPLEQSPDGTLLVVSKSHGYNLRSFSIHDRETLATQFLVRQADAQPRHFAPDNSRLYYTTPTEGLFALDLTTGSISKLAPIPHILSLAQNSQTGQLVTLSGTWNSDAQSLHRIDPTGANAPQLLGTITAQNLPWLEFKAILPAREPDQALLVFREIGPPKNQWDPKTWGDFRFTQVSLETGAIARSATMPPPDENFYLYETIRWTNDQRQLLEYADGAYYQIDPYAGKITRTLDLHNVRFDLYPNHQVVSLRTVTEEGETRHYQDFLQGGTLKTIRNVRVPEPNTWPPLPAGLIESLNLPDLPSPSAYANYAFHPGKPEFFATDSGEGVHFFRVAPSGLKHQSRGMGAYQARYTPDGKHILFEGLFDPPSEQIVADKFPSPGSLVYQDPPLRNANPVYTGDHEISPSGNWLIKINNRDATLHRFGDPAILSSLGGVGTYDAPMPSFRFASDETAIYRLARTVSWDDYDNQIIGLRLEALPFDPANESPEPTWSVELPHGNLVWLDQTVSQKIQFLDTQSGELLVLDPRDGSSSSQAIPGLDPENFVVPTNSVQWHPSRDLVYVASGSQVTTLDLAASPPTAASVTVPASIRQLHRYGDGRHLVAQLETGPLVFLDTQSTPLRPALQLEFYDLDQGDYLAFTPNGKYDASAPIRQSGQLLQGTRPTALASIFERDYRPNLLATALGEDALSADEEIPAYVQPPSLSVGEQWVSALERRIVVNTETKQYPLATVSIYQNEKLVHSFPADGKTSLRDNHVLDLLLEQNRIKVVSTNTAGVSVTSKEIVIDPPEALLREKIAARRPAELHLFAVGVNQYRNPEYNLNFAEADATGVLQKIQAANANLFAKINVHHLESPAATHDGILAAFAQIRANALPHDAFIFYFAGHGVMSREDAQFYLIPHDVTRIYGASQSLTQNGISANQLRDISATIKAQKQLFILDACNSGGALQAFAQRGASQEKALAQLARATGTHWIAASSASQFATEFADLGHGAFTHTLLQALDGEADTGDRRITINELKAYLESELPTITQKYKGAPQYPASYGYGQDFPIALLP
ncbi:caspase family protein [Pelagicoccus sp. SDUM812002]|uniref:caspase family protein n=1 Tax=Pelagicoccus sp. SDUM812002 TaxID=3041266 RepID=UPI00280C974A|nr:caspase family protein [Pelagicoccus sp. SDUM812002]MDQ8186866.1 caspase family protein [Pelagicoccus sp. SDUM812002]